MSQDRLFVVSSDPADAESIARPLRDRGWTVETECKDSAAACWRIAQQQPVAVIISLEFQAEDGCDLACALSVAESTKDVPVIFVGGTTADIETVRSAVPHARFVLAPHVPWEVKQLALRQ